MSNPTGNPVTEARSAGRNALDESAGKQLLAAHGITVPQSRVVKGVADVDAVMKGLQTPVVVKVMSPDILHKSDAGGVKVNLRTAAEVKAAIEGMLNAPKIKGARLDGFLIEEMAPAGHEMVIGGAGRHIR
jgi:acyl-CoA synthetase (NDP forming)